MEVHFLQLRLTRHVEVFFLDGGAQVPGNQRINHALPDILWEL